MAASLCFSIPTPTNSLPSHSPPHLSSVPSTNNFPIAVTKSQKLPIRFLGLHDSRYILVKTHALLTDNFLADSLATDSGTMLMALFPEMSFTKKQAESLLIAPLESIRTRLHLLQSIGISLHALSRLVLKRPDVLISEEVGRFISSLRNFDLEFEEKINPCQIERLLKSTEPRVLHGFEEKVKFLLHSGIPREKMVHILNNVNLAKAFCLKSIEEIDRMLTFLNRFGGINLILRRPAILNYDLDTQLIPRINSLLDLSEGDEVATAMILQKLPFIVSYSVEHFKDHVNFLMSFAGLTKPEIFRIALVHPTIFTASRDRKLHPRIDFLKQHGFNSRDIYRFLVRSPLFISLSKENLGCKLGFLFKIGYENKTKELALALGSATRTSCKNMQDVVGVYLRFGLSCEDIKEMSKKHPQVLHYNHKSLEKKIDYLIGDMGREVRELLAFPAFLGYKLDSRIKHRYEVEKKILGEGLSINKLLNVSEARFSTKCKKRLVKTSGTIK